MMAGPKKLSDIAPGDKELTHIRGGVEELMKEAEMPVVRGGRPRHTPEEVMAIQGPNLPVGSQRTTDQADELDVDDGLPDDLSGEVVDEVTTPFNGTKSRISSGTAVDRPSAPPSVPAQPYTRGATQIAVLPLGSTSGEEQHHAGLYPVLRPDMLSKAPSSIESLDKLQIQPGTTVALVKRQLDHNGNIGEILLESLQGIHDRNAPKIGKVMGEGDEAGLIRYVRDPNAKVVPTAGHPFYLNASVTNPETGETILQFEQTGQVNRILDRKGVYYLITKNGTCYQVVIGFEAKPMEATSEEMQKFLEKIMDGAPIELKKLQNRDSTQASELPVSGFLASVANLARHVAKNCELGKTGKLSRFPAVGRHLVIDVPGAYRTYGPIQRIQKLGSTLLLTMETGSKYLFEVK